MLECVCDSGPIAERRLVGHHPQGRRRRSRLVPEQGKKLRLQNRQFCKAVVGALAAGQGVATLAESLDPINQNWNRFLRESGNSLIAGMEAR